MNITVADGAAQERAKYAEIWSLDEYRNAHSPGEENVERFMAVMSPEIRSTIIDIGCGAGRAGLAFDRNGFKAHWLDITGVALDPDVDRRRFIETPLWSHWAHGRHWHYGFCCDVLEHIPPEYVMLVCDRILSACDTAWLQISNLPDEFGKLIGEPLHLTVQPYSWWLLRLATIGRVVDARDLCGSSLFIVRR